jgi:Tol biopolymer transport system component
VSELAVLDEDGGAKSLNVSPGPYESPRVSPDGKRVVYGINDRREASIWVYDLDGAAAPRRLTFGGNNRYPLWSADGKTIAFQSDREGDLAIFSQAADVSGAAAQRLTKPDKGTAHVPESWSRTADLFLFSEVKGATATLWAFSMSHRTATQTGDARSTSPLNAELSPDGRWVAYTLRSGAATATIYVEPFPSTGAKSSIPGELSHHTLWSPNGKTLFYVPGANPIAGVNVTTQPALTFGNPITWPGKLPNVTPFAAPRNFDMFPDGKRFIYTRVRGSQTGAGGTAPIQVVVNWWDELKLGQ